MSITDWTTSLDTAWTEQDGVAFTAGTLADSDAMITEVESKLKRGTLTSTSTPSTVDVTRWLIRAKEELVEIKKFSFRRRYAYCSTVADQYRYSLPPDYNGGNVTIRDVTNNRNIRIWSEAWFDRKYPDPSEETSGEIMIACIKDRELWIIPPAGGVYQLELEYGRSGDDNTTTDFSWLPEIERFRCCDFAVGESFESLHMHDMAAIFKNKWAAGLMKAIKADGKRKWKSMNYSALDVFQESAALSSQPNNT